jgi:hypothetical protein
MSLLSDTMNAVRTDNSTTTTTPAPAPRITDRAILVDLDMHRWTASKKDKEVSHEVAQNHGSDAGMGRFTKDLIAKEPLKKLNSVYTEAGAYHREHTTAWMDSGPRLMSASFFDTYRDKMADFELQWNSAVADFVAGYAGYVQDARLSLGTLFKDSDYPTPQEVERAYSFGYKLMPVPDSKHFEVLGVNAHVAEMQRRTEQQTAEALKATARDIGLRVKTAVQHMANKLNAYKVTSAGTEGIFRDTLVENVRELADLIPVLNVAGDPELDRIAQEMRDLCVWSPEVLRENVQARQETAEKATAILATLGDLI